MDSQQKDWSNPEVVGRNKEPGHATLVPFADVEPALAAHAGLIIDREASKALQDELRICGGARVPVVVFLTEDFFEVGRFGDRLLAAYRAKAAREASGACATGLVAPPAEELAAELGDWIDVFERMLLMVRLSAHLRARHGD